MDSGLFGARGLAGLLAALLRGPFGDGTFGLFTVDLGTTERLARRLAESRGDERLLVAESGIHTRAAVERLEACGTNAILVGTALMRQPDIAAKAVELLG